MVEHIFICPVCSVTKSDTTSRGVHVCDCGAEMYWDLHGGTTCSSGPYHFISQSMAINPEQTAAHRKMFPDVGVRPDGCLEFDSVRSRSNYMDACGADKPAQKLR